MRAFGSHSQGLQLGFAAASVKASNISSEEKPWLLLRSFSLRAFRMSRFRSINPPAQAIGPPLVDEPCLPFPTHRAPPPHHSLWWQPRASPRTHGSSCIRQACAPCPRDKGTYTAPRASDPWWALRWRQELGRRRHARRRLLSGVHTDMSFARRCRTCPAHASTPPAPGPAAGEGRPTARGARCIPRRAPPLVPPPSPSGRVQSRPPHRAPGTCPHSSPSGRRSRSSAPRPAHGSGTGRPGRCLREPRRGRRSSRRPLGVGQGLWRPSQNLGGEACVATSAVWVVAPANVSKRLLSHAETGGESCNVHLRAIAPIVGLGSACGAFVQAFVQAHGVSLVSVRLARRALG